ncbi:hypothetical protein [Nocardia araoensis]|uniref:hypothetical protein n=1 Tax=Nocardia araoensis TaxID=228600 RepID=UPI0012F6CDB5|nr:hypothetical protein [Nocardia araoensis]
MTWQHRRRSRLVGAPLNVLAILGGAGHNWFERWAGVGMALEPWLGRRASNFLWAIVPVHLVHRCDRQGHGDEAVLAFNAGVSVATVAVHFVDWPWSRRLGVVPWLQEAEGMEPRLLPAYNTVLLMWGISSAGAILVETRRSDLKYVIAGLLTFPLQLASARHHFVWAQSHVFRAERQPVEGRVQGLCAGGAVTADPVG